MLNAASRAIYSRKIPAVLFILALLAAACVPITLPTPEPDASMTTPAAPGEIGEPSGVLTGTVTSLQHIALPPGSVIEVKLQDVSRADVAAEVIAGRTITTTGENVPIPFTLIYDPAQIDPRNSYALGVRINVDGQLQWINTEHHGVLTRGAPMTGVEVVVHPVR